MKAYFVWLLVKNVYKQTIGVSARSRIAVGVVICKPFSLDFRGHFGILKGHDPIFD